MKKMFKLFMCAAVITAGFTACSETEVIPGPGGEEPTETGLLTINFSDPTPMTYASGDVDGNATDDERTVFDVTILVFNMQGVCKVDTTIPLAGLTPGTTGTGNTYKANIVVPLGNHHVYAGVNLTSDMKSKLGVKGTSNGVMQLVNLGTATVPDLTEIGKLYTAGKFPMFSSEDRLVNIEPKPATNPVTIPLDRLVAKITVCKGTAFNTNNMDNLKASGAIFSQSINWSVGNLNGKIYPYGKANFGQDPNYDYSGKLLDPNGGPVDYVKENFKNDFNTTDNTNYSAWTGFTLFADENATAAASRKAKYAPENNSALKRIGESTFAVVRAKFAPEKIYTYTTGDPAPVEVTTGYTPDTTTFETFYVVESTQAYYFRAAADAQAYVADNPSAKMKTYLGQYCFYRLLLGKDKDEKGLTLRNRFYSITVNKFTGLGTPKAEIPDEELDNTGDNQGLLDVTITINQWQTIEQDADLGD
jgi:hypothetical protein